MRVVGRPLVEQLRVPTAARTRKMRDPLCQNEGAHIAAVCETATVDVSLGNAATDDGVGSSAKAHSSAYAKLGAV